MTRSYYNENDPCAAQWLRNLMAHSLIPEGDVDDRSVELVRSSDLAGYRQCHFFAGIGGWPLALALAEWPEDREVWTGSCPCQPFSAAGKQRGTDDARHLWPVWHDFIAEHRPATVFGEQVASPLGREWLTGVRAEMETLGYAVGAADLCSAGVSAPHIRQRLWWVADADGRDASAEGIQRGGQHGQQSEDGCATGVADTDSEREGGRRIQGPGESLEAVSGATCERSEGLRATGGLGDAHGPRLAQRQKPEGRSAMGHQGAPISQAGPLDFWSDAELIPCADGKARRIEPGTFPLAHGVLNRVGQLRAYGNAIVPQVAAEFVSAFMECDVL